VGGKKQSNRKGTSRNPTKPLRGALDTDLGPSKDSTCRGSLHEKKRIENIENKIKESVPVHSMEKPETPKITSSSSTSSSSSIEPSSPENLGMESDLFHD
jgi:hypothetical protein